MRIIVACAALAVFSSLGIVPAANGTEVYPLLSQETIEGEWVSVDWETAEVIRLEVKDGKATLALTTGVKQPEFVFRAEKLVVRRGKVMFDTADDKSGLTLRVAGQGRATRESGTMTLTLADTKRKPSYWDTIERLFVKGSSKWRIDYLLSLDARSKELTSGVAKPCCP
jgi:hypothetical protein